MKTNEDDRYNIVLSEGAGASTGGIKQETHLTRHYHVELGEGGRAGLLAAGIGVLIAGIGVAIFAVAYAI